MSDTGNHVSLRDYIEQAINSLKEEIRKSERFLINEISHVEVRTQDKLKVQEFAIGKALASLNERLAQMNEFRAAMAAQQATYATKDMLNITLESIRKETTLSLDALRKELAPLQASMQQGEGSYTRGRDSVTNAGYVYIPIVAVAIAVVSIIIALLKP